MSRSYKKHCGSSFICYRSDKPWRRQWHSAMRARERDLFIQQKKYLEDDYCYPIPKEVSDLYDAPSDGGSQWMYSGFEHYYFEKTHPRWPWLSTEIPTREAAWRKWITGLVGK
ncbi:MAG: hypothetical protein FWC24_01900 [Treponema sp.]|nr:hypothetical protein [Treponema sp.]